MSDKTPVRVERPTPRTRRKDAMARAWSHPIRVKAFRLLADDVLSPIEIARLIDEPVHKVGYHVRQLEEFGLVELVSMRQVRGATQHFYRAIERPAMDEVEWSALDIAERAPLSRYTLQLIFGDATVADEAGTLDARTDRHLSRVPQQVDEPGYEELRRIHELALEEVLAVQERVAARRAEDQSIETFPVISSQLFFTMPPESGQASGDS